MGVEVDKEKMEKYASYYKHAAEAEEMFDPIRPG